MPTQWESIKTAPKDGTIVIGLGYHPNKLKEETHKFIMNHCPNMDVRLTKASRVGGHISWLARDVRDGLREVGCLRAPQELDRKRDK